MSRETLNQMDLQHKGYITLDEYVKLYAKHHGEEHATSIFKAMDHGTGKVIDASRLSPPHGNYTLHLDGTML